jgi:hypothetical protein
MAARGARAAAEQVRRIGVLMNVAGAIHRVASRRSSKPYNNWAGATAAMCGSIIRVATLALQNPNYPVCKAEPFGHHRNYISQ